MTIRRFFIVLVRGIFLKGMSFEDVFYNLIPLFIIAMLTLSLASLTFIRKLDLYKIKLKFKF